MDGRLRGHFRAGLPSLPTVRATPDPAGVSYSAQLWVDDTDYGVVHTTDLYPGGLASDMFFVFLVGSNGFFTGSPVSLDFWPGFDFAISQWRCGTSRGGNDIWELTDATDLIDIIADSPGTDSFAAGVGAYTLADYNNPGVAIPEYGGNFGAAHELGALTDTDLYYRFRCEFTSNGPPPTAGGRTATRRTSISMLLQTEELGGGIPWGANGLADSDGLVDQLIALGVGVTSDFESVVSTVAVPDGAAVTVDVLLHREPLPALGRLSGAFRT